MENLNYNNLGEFIPILRVFPQKFKLYKKPRCLRVFLYLLLNAYRITSFPSSGNEDYIERKGQYKCTVSEIVDALGNGVTRNDINYTVKLLKKAGYILYKGFKRNAATLFEIVDYEQYSLENIAYDKCAWFPVYKNCLFLSIFKKEETFRVYISLMSRTVNANKLYPVSFEILHKETGVSRNLIIDSLKELRKKNIIAYKKISNDRILSMPCNRGLANLEQEISTTFQQPFNNSLSTFQQYKKAKSLENNINRSICVSGGCKTDSTTFQQPFNNSESYEKEAINMDAEQNFGKPNIVREKDKDIELENNNNNNNACAKEKLTHDIEWLNAVCKIKNLDKQSVLKFLECFFLDLIAHGREKANIEDYKSYFCNWLDKQTKTKLTKDKSQRRKIKNNSEESSEWTYQPLTAEEKKRKDIRERARLLKLVELSTKGDKGAAIELEEKYEDGTLQRLGIAWTPAQTEVQQNEVVSSERIDDTDTIISRHEAKELAFLKEASSDVFWIKNIMAYFKINDKKKLDTFLQDFLNWVIYSRKTHDSVNSFQRHFACWLRIKAEHGELNNEYQNISVYGYHGNNIPSWDTDAQQEYMQQRRQASTTRLMEEIVRQGAAAGGGGSLGW